MIGKLLARWLGFRRKPRITVEPYAGPERCDKCFGPNPDKPPVSDPEEPKDRPL